MVYRCVALRDEKAGARRCEAGEKRTLGASQDLLSYFVSPTFCGQNKIAKRCTDFVGIAGFSSRKIPVTESEWARRMLKEKGSSI